MQLLKKMSAATIIGEKIKSIVSANIKEDGGKIDLYTIFGIANGIKTGEHATNGPWVAFTGNFEATNLLTGEVSKSGVAFLQAPMDALLQGALANNEEVSFSMTVGVKRREDLAVGYEYLVRPHVEASQADPLAALRQQTQAALAAPEADHADKPAKVKKS